MTIDHIVPKWLRTYLNNTLIESAIGAGLFWSFGSIASDFYPKFIDAPFWIIGILAIMAGVALFGVLIGVGGYIAMTVAYFARRPARALRGAVNGFIQAWNDE